VAGRQEDFRILLAVLAVATLVTAGVCGWQAVAVHAEVGRLAEGFAEGGGPPDLGGLRRGLVGTAVLGAVVCLVLAVVLAWLASRPSSAPAACSPSAPGPRPRKEPDTVRLETLAAGIAHEIRNPLTAMKARCFALRELVAPGSPPHKQAEVIESELDRLERMVRDFLDFTRPSELDLEDVVVGELLAGVADLMRDDLESSRVRLGVEVPDRELSVRLDPRQIRQVLINLLRNAAEACGADGGEVTLSCGATDSGIRISVSDNGAGIPPEIRDQLFTPFFSRKPGGTGLGLSIARTIALKHGGALTFESEEGRGSVFHLTLHSSGR
jgi:signal transduction histidine kinase